jgi:hypothetical protein
MFPSLVSLKSASLAPGGTGLPQKANLPVPQKYPCAVPPVGPTSRAVEYPGSQAPLTPSFPVAAAVNRILVDYMNVDINIVFTTAYPTYVNRPRVLRNCATVAPENVITESHESDNI